MKKREGMEKYQIIYADPPWRYRENLNWKEKGIKRTEDFFPTMTDIQLRALKLPAEKDSWIFLWATATKLPECIELLGLWGFDYRTCGVWDKGNGLGYFFRLYHEILLIGKKGNPKKPLFSEKSIFTEKRRAYSQKPECVRKWIETAFPDLTKIELFARQKTEGWDVWGNEVESDIEL